MKVAYWPGCVSRGFTPELHGSMAKVAPLLDIELVELDRASCCGAGVIAEHNQELADTLNARTFALAQQEIAGGADLMMNICSTCQGAQNECQERLDGNTEYRDHINETLAPEGLTYERGISNKNFLWLMVEEIGLDAIKEKVKRPLTDLRVGPFYGCYIVRPTDRLGIDREHPRDRYLQQLIEALGGTVVDYAGQYKCCGFPIITMNREASLKQAGRHLGDAIDADADCLVTPCPLCHLNLDLQQPLAEKVVGRDARDAGAAPAAARRARPRARAQGARDEQARRAADLGDRLVDLRGRRRRRATTSARSPRRLVARGRGASARRPRARAGPRAASLPRLLPDRLTRNGHAHVARYAWPAGVAGAGWPGTPPTRCATAARARHGYELRGECDPAGPEFLRAAEAITGAPISWGNDVELLVNGDQIFPCYLETIRDAQRTLCMLTYAYWRGGIADEVADALCERAAAGVECNVIIDAMGGVQMEPDVLRADDRTAGVRVSRFRPPKPYAVRRLANRTHRKILVADGEVGLTGGVGIAEEWTGDAQDPDHWRDTHVRVRGPVVRGLFGAFAENWLEATGEVLVGDGYTPELEAVDDGGPMQVVRSSAGVGDTNVEALYYLAIAAARESLDLTAAYFVPRPAFSDALEAAARARGARARARARASTSTRRPCASRAAPATTSCSTAASSSTSTARRCCTRSRSCSTASGPPSARSTSTTAPSSSTTRRRCACSRARSPRSSRSSSSATSRSRTHRRRWRGGPVQRARGGVDWRGGARRRNARVVEARAPKSLR